MQEFDYVFDIELDEGGPTMRKLKLPYNRDSKMPTWILYCVWLMVFIFLSLIKLILMWQQRISYQSTIFHPTTWIKWLSLSSRMLESIMAHPVQLQQIPSLVSLNVYCSSWEPLRSMNYIICDIILDTYSTT